MSRIFNRKKTHKSGSVPKNNNDNDSIASTNSVDEGDDTARGAALWQQQFNVSEESRSILSAELLQQKQRADDLEKKLILMQKQLEIVNSTDQRADNSKVTANTYETLLINFDEKTSDEQTVSSTISPQLVPFLNAYNPSFQTTTDDVNTLKSELQTIRQRLNEVSFQKEQLVTRLRTIASENCQYEQKINQLENATHRNLLVYDGILTEHTYQIKLEQCQIQQLVHSARMHKGKVVAIVKLMHNNLTQAQNQVRQLEQANTQLTNELEQRKKLNDNLINNLQVERKQANSYRTEIESLKSEIRNLERKLDEFQNENIRLIRTTVDTRNENINPQPHTQQLVDKEDGQINELKQALSIKCEQNDAQNREIERLKNELELSTHRTENDILIESTSIQQELEVKQQTIDKLQATISELHTEINRKNQQFATKVQQSIGIAHRISQYLHQHVQKYQANLLEFIEQTKQESHSYRTQMLEEIRMEYITYLTVAHKLIVDSKNKFEKEDSADRSSSFEQLYYNIKRDYDELVKENNQQKLNFTSHLAELNENLLQASTSLPKSTETADRQRETYEKQINSLESELDARTKRHEMQLSALMENLANVRGELRNAQEKLSTFERLKSEKADVEGRLILSQDERRALLERSLASENKYVKLLSENGLLTKKYTELESALQELFQQYQVLQMRTHKINARRWLDDDDVDSCMKCNQTFTVTQRKHHCRSCGNIFCETCSSKTAIVAASSKKPQRVCDQCYEELTS